MIGAQENSTEVNHQMSPRTAKTGVIERNATFPHKMSGRFLSVGCMGIPLGWVGDGRNLS